MRNLLLAAVLCLKICDVVGSAVCTTCANHLFSCGNCMCIPERWVCDGDFDCDNRQDEKDCVPPTIPTCPPDHFPCANNRCVKNDWLCDGDNDCGDNSDEVSCPSRSCTADEFSCNNGKCVPHDWRCDHDNDCGDGSDEFCPNTTRLLACSSKQFQCGDRSCIPQIWRCDKDVDCTDGADEKNCNKDELFCSKDEFQCLHTFTCIPKSLRCDHVNDCGNWEDEAGCALFTECKESEFRCNDSMCINKEWRCDGDIDCNDQSDEENCDIAHTCSTKQFQCDNGYCVSKEAHCDGNLDCVDHSDEKGCSNGNECTSKQFRCANHNCVHKRFICNGFDDCGDNTDEMNCNPCGTGQFRCNNKICIGGKKVCNGVNDCGDDSDEQDCNFPTSCDLQRGGCSQQCLETAAGPVCSCKSGYRLLEDQRTCEDVNECNWEGTCSQTCQNSIGSYRCSCVEGYWLKPDKRGCKARGGKAYLIFANRIDIRKILTDKTEFDSILEGLPNAIALDFHHSKGYVFWSDIALDKIKRAYINGSEIKDIVKYGLDSPGGIAVDWVHNLLFWADSGTSTIEVTDIDGKYRKVLLWYKLEKPRAIAVHPGQGSIFWTDWGSVPKIERSYMDGTGRKVIADTSLFWPNGLTLDYATDKLYWADAKHHVIECADLSGKNRRTIIDQGLPHPFALTLFEDELYWTDWHTKSINKANKFTGNNIETVHNRLNFPMDIHTFHPQRQPMVENHCGSDHGNCSHLCLPNITSYSCACPTGQHLSPDNKTCTESMDNFLVFSTRSHIRRISMDTPDKVDVVIPLANVVSAVGVDFDPLTDTIYWTDTGTDTISKARWDGTQEEVVVAKSLEFPAGLAIDWVSRKLYWTDSDLDVIEVSNLDGSLRSILFWEGLDQPRDIIVDPAAGYMYWTDWGKNAKIEKAGMDGKGREVLISQNLTSPNGLALDIEKGRIYWTDSGRNTIESATVEGKNRRTIISIDLPRPFGLALHEDKIYWTDWINKGIQVANKRDGSNRQTLRSNLGHVMDVRMFHKQKTIVHNICDDNNGGCSHLCLRSPNKTGYSCACPTGILMTKDGKTCEKGMKDFLIFARRRDIRKISLEVDYFADVVIPLGELRNAIAIGVDSIRGKVYWTDTVLDKIMRAGLDGSQVEEVIGEGLDTPDGLVVDEVGSKIYWTDTGLNRIEVADINDFTRKVLFWQDVDKPRAITLYYDGGFLYWTDWGRKPRIERANLDGGQRRAIVDKNLGWPNGLAIDKASARIFWADARMEVIESTDLHGQDRHVVVTNINHPYGLAVFGDYIYWTDWQKLAIFQADKATGQNQTSKRRNLSGLMDIHSVHIHTGNPPLNKCGENNGGCSHLCLPHPWGITCACPTGLLLNDDAESCRSIPNEYILFASRGSIRRISLDTDDMIDVYLPLKDLHNVIAIDYDIRSQKLFYTDVHLDVIRRCNFDGSDLETIVHENLETTDGVAVDWTGRNIFWTDTGRDVIEVSWLDGSYRKQLITKYLDEPRAIALFPSKGLMYWTDWGVKPKIEMAYMDGTHRHIIINSELGFPNGLSVDYHTDRLYWVDAKLDKIETSDLKGNNRVTLIQDVAHPFGLTVYGEYIYWTDWQTELIEKASKHNGNHRQIIQKNLEGLMDIEIIAKNRQQGKNGCSKNNGGCSHLCLARPDGYSCMCPEKPESIKCIPRLMKINGTNGNDFSFDDFNLPWDVDTTPQQENPECTDEQEELGLCKKPVATSPQQHGVSGSMWAMIALALAAVTVAILITVVICQLYRRRQRNAYNVESEELWALTFANPTYQKTSTETINSTASTSSRNWKIFRFNKKNEQVQILRSNQDHTNTSETTVLVQQTNSGGVVSKPLTINKSMFKPKTSEDTSTVPYRPVET